MARRQRTERFRLVLGKSRSGDRLPNRKARRARRARPVKQTHDPRVVVRALRATLGAEEVIQQVPNLVKWQIWRPTATFSVCQKTGTALYLDVWDCDQFDGFTDMQRNLSECRVWFAADGFTYWDSPETKTGRINCYFRAPAEGNYVCNVQLQSHAGPAVVNCLIDDFSFGPLPFNGTINQPHPCNLDPGYHSFRIRQVSGSYFFNSLTVWQVPVVA